MQSLKLKIAQVSRVMGGQIPAEGPPSPGQEHFMKPININGERSWNLLVGVYKVLFNMDGVLDGSQDWVLDQQDLLNLGCTMTLQLYPLMAIIQVHNHIVNIAENATVARLVSIDRSCGCSCSSGDLK